MEKQKIGKDVTDYYKPYANTNSKWKLTVLKEQEFQVDSRYHVDRILGQGAYGVVAAAKDLSTVSADKKTPPIQVAIKKINLAFDHKIYTRRTLRELKLLRLLNHEDVLGIETILLPKSREDFEHIYVVTELMQSDLARVIKNVKLEQVHHKNIMYDLLRGLKYIHSANVLHRDLKPRNILINEDCSIKICDFGLARLAVQPTKAKSNAMTDYIVTRWYRAPELLLSAKDYTSAVDMWSAGCIFGEILRGKAILPGADTKSQLEEIFAYLGVPDKEDLEHFSEENRELIKHIASKMVNTGKSLDKLIEKSSPEARDLLRKMLCFNPAKRITVDQALKHPYFATITHKGEAKVRGPINPLEFEFQNYSLTMQQLKDLVYEEILLYHNEAFAAAYKKALANSESTLKFVLENSNSKLIDPQTDYDDYD